MAPRAHLHLVFSLCRARPVVTVDAQLLLHPVIINLENKTCQIPEFMTSVAWWVSPFKWCRDFMKEFNWIDGFCEGAVLDPFIWTGLRHCISLKQNSRRCWCCRSVHQIGVASSKSLKQKPRSMTWSWPFVVSLSPEGDFSSLQAPGEMRSIGLNCAGPLISRFV